MSFYILRAYGQHRWPEYYRRLLKRWRKFAELAKCCDSCRAEAGKR